MEYYAWDEVSETLLRKRIKISLSFQTKKSRVHEAIKIIADTNLLLERGYYFKKPEVTVETDIVKESEDDLVISLERVLATISPTLKPKTKLTYQSAVNKLKDFAGKRTLLTSIYVDKDVILFRDYLLTTLKNSSTTANNTIIHLGTLYSHLKERVELPDNHFKLRKLKQEATTKNIAFTDLEREVVERYMRNYDPDLFSGYPICLLCLYPTW